MEAALVGALVLAEDTLVLAVGLLVLAVGALVLAVGGSRHVHVHVGRDGELLQSRWWSGGRRKARQGVQEGRVGRNARRLSEEQSVC